MDEDRGEQFGLKEPGGILIAKVVDNLDPMMIGRIQATVPDVSALSPTSWAMPGMVVACTCRWRWITTASPSAGPMPAST